VSIGQRIDADVAIVGGGIAGCCAAFNLATRGLSVCLIEKGAVGAGASGANFGGVRQQGRNLAELPLSRRARAIWGELPKLIGTDGEFAAIGHLKLAYSVAEMASLEAYAAQTREHGLALELIGRDRLLAMHPWLGPEVWGGSLCAEDGAANPRIVAPAFARAARSRGARILEFTRAVEIKAGDGFAIATDRGEEIAARWLVNTAGAWAAAIAKHFGETVPLQAIAPNCMVTEPVPAFMTRSLGICGGGVALRQTPQGSVVIGGGESFVDMGAGRARPVSAVCETVLRRAIRAVPALARVHVLRAWAGVEGDMIDHVPVVGPSRTTPSLIHAFGFSQHGFQLGPAVGEAIADLITAGEARVDIARLGIGRFAAACRG
jgi:sarcosine oxidase, subunit beta